MRRKFPISVDVRKCTRCGLCSKVCPVRNIILEGFHGFGDRCLSCQRCVSLCPEEAIGVQGRSFVPYRGRTSKRCSIWLAMATSSEGPEPCIEL
ncbi:MAG: 4Fe-4S binding protein [Synergistaceae bacterium]|nr:4Fe-4S binding protein [Synergistaceae bacterium]